jgi:hypothetical protein
MMMRRWDWMGNWPDKVGWKQRHYGAIVNEPLAEGLRAWCRYAERLPEMYGHQIGEDTALRDAWAAWGEALRRLLDGPVGGLDAGTVAGIIEHNLTAQGWDIDCEGWVNETDRNGAGNGVAD